MNKIILTPNPYRDKNFQTVRAAMEVLKDSGADVRMQAIPVEGGYRYSDIDGKSVLIPDMAKNRKALEELLK